MSLRTRLSLITVLVALLALAGANFAVYHLVSGYLDDRFDERVEGVSGLALRSLEAPLPSLPRPERTRSASRTKFDLADAYGEIRSSNGDLVARGFLLPSHRVRHRPTIPRGELDVRSGSEHFFDTTAPAASGDVPYRVRVASVTPGVVLVVAVPATELLDTKHQIVLIEVLASAAVVIAGLVLTWWLVGVGLRPLRRIEATAGRIAGGDLSQRVTPADGRSEIARLGMSLNSMLGELESAFAAKDASEATLRRFVADASHELRTPLTSIRGYAELLRRGADEDRTERLAAARRIEQESTRMSTLVDDLLLLARLDEGVALERQPVDLVRVAHDAVFDARVVDADRAIEVSGPPSIVVMGDRNRLVQVLTNLLGNARTHTPPGTPIEVRVGRNGDAVVEVIDHGPGINAATAARVFDRFWRADDSRSRAHGGAGLGLSIVAAVVAAHHGYVDVDQTLGGGATFRIHLPLDSATVTRDGGASGTEDIAGSEPPVVREGRG